MGVLGAGSKTHPTSHLLHLRSLFWAIFNYARCTGTVVGLWWGQRSRLQGQRRSILHWEKKHTQPRNRICKQRLTLLAPTRWSCFMDCFYYELSLGPRLSWRIEKKWMTWSQYVSELWNAEMWAVIIIHLDREQHVEDISSGLILRCTIDEVSRKLTD